MSVVPIRTVTWLVDASLTPVSSISKTVGTVAPSLLVEVTLNGSMVPLVKEFVIFNTAARPPASLVDVKMSGTENNRLIELRTTAPLLFITTGNGVLEGAKPGGTTKLSCPGETK